MAENKVHEAEAWRSVAGFEGYYEVSRQGRVRNAQGRVLKPRMVRGRYQRYNLYRGGKCKTMTAHAIVARAFLGPPPTPLGTHSGGTTVNHINGIKTDNRVENLEYLSIGENLRHATRNGLKAKGSRHGNAALTEEEVAAMRALYNQGRHSQVEVGRMFGISQGQANKILRGIAWTHVECYAGLVPPV